MELFHLPPSTVVNRVVHKNNFDKATARQKKLLSELVVRITWTHKLSPDTINLDAKDIEEIQVFRIELKEKETIKSILEIIDKAIPYPIIFVVDYEGSVYLSTSPKHLHPTKANTCVIDYTFSTAWFAPADNCYQFTLQKNLDTIYQDFCTQLSGNKKLAKTPLPELIEQTRLTDSLQKEIAQLKNRISGCQQFKQKVELNGKLKAAEAKLIALNGGK